jgi:hypothetical protein
VSAGAGVSTGAGAGAGAGAHSLAMFRTGEAFGSLLSAAAVMVSGAACGGSGDGKWCSLRRAHCIHSHRPLSRTVFH